MIFCAVACSPLIFLLLFILLSEPAPQQKIPDKTCDLTIKQVSHHQPNQNPRNQFQQPSKKCGKNLQTWEILLYQNPRTHTLLWASAPNRKPLHVDVAWPQLIKAGDVRRITTTKTWSATEMRKLANQNRGILGPNPTSHQSLYSLH